MTLAPALPRPAAQDEPGGVGISNQILRRASLMLRSSNWGSIADAAVGFSHFILSRDEVMPKTGESLCGWGRRDKAIAGN
jgi:hypothetical protein